MPINMRNICMQYFDGGTVDGAKPLNAGTRKMLLRGLVSAADPTFDFDSAMHRYTITVP